MVEVLPLADILHTLDRSGALDAVPFMPEMAQYAGQRFTVSNRVEKICDTIGPGGSRRMRNTVFLEDLRCDGSAHSGCQAECRIYWKEAWLNKVDTEPTLGDAPERVEKAELQILTQHARVRDETGTGAEIFKCQATEAFRATERIASVVSPGQYTREIVSANISVQNFLHVAFRAIAWKLGGQLGLSVGSRQRLPSDGRRPDPDQQQKLHLKAGDWVEVRSAKEISRTLNAKHCNAGLSFSAPEMLPACGRKFRVRKRIEKLIDEKTGHMLTFKNECIALEGLICAGDRSAARWFCPRQLYPYWREAWLKRTDPPEHVMTGE